MDTDLNIPKINLVPIDGSPSASLELQCLDCNCNDCVFMIRDTDKFKKSLEDHKKWQYDHFLTIKNKLIDKALFAKTKFNDLLKWNDLLVQADKLKFQFDKSECVVNYGTCANLNKNVSFIPNTLQLETQSCFKHRRMWKIE